MGRMTWIIVILALYLIVMFVIGLRGTKYTKSNQDFMTAAKKGTLLLVTGSYLGSHIGNGVVVGGAQQGAMYGLGGVWYGIGTAFSYIIFALVMAKPIYREGAVTIPDTLQRHYGDKVTVALVAALNIAAQISIVAGQIMAGRLLFDYFGMSGILGAIITFGVVIVYSAAAGLWGVLMTDVIQSSIIVIVLVCTAIWIFSSGGSAVMTAANPPEYFDFFSIEAETIFFMFVPTMLNGLVSQAGFQRTAASQTKKVASLAPWIGGLFIIPFAFLPVLMGMFAHTLHPDTETTNVFFQLIFEDMPPVLSGLLVASIMAAVMSTCDGCLITCAANVTNDFYGKVMGKQITDAHAKKISFIATIVVGLFALFISLQFNSLVSLLGKAYALMNAGSIVMILGGIFWRKATKQGAIASFICGVAAQLFVTFGVINPPMSGIFGMWFSLAAFIVVCLATQPKDGSDPNVPTKDLPERA